MKLTKAIWDALPAGPVKDAFKPTAANPEEYDNGEENAPALKAALEREKEVATERGRKLAEYDTAKAAEIETARKKALEDARSTGDFKTIEDDYKKKIADLEKQTREAAEATATRTKADAIDKEANELAKSFVSPTLALPAIRARLSADLVDGVAIVRVLGVDGKASAASVADLKTEYLTNPEYKDSIRASGGSGGGATPPAGGGGATPTKLSDFKGNLTAESKFANEHPAEHAAMVRAAEAGQ